MRNKPSIPRAVVKEVFDAANEYEERQNQDYTHMIHGKLWEQEWTKRCENQ